MSLSSRKVPEIPNAQFSSEHQTGTLQLLERMYFDNWRYRGKQNPVILIISGLLIKGIIEIFVIYKVLYLYHLIPTSWKPGDSLHMFQMRKQSLREIKRFA